MNKLIIGAGERLEAGYIHHDIQNLPGIDVICDFWDLPDNVDNDFNEIKMTHVLEHFPIAKTRAALGLIKDLLAEGGRLYLEVPNFEWQAQMIIEDPTNRQIVEYAYGGQHNKWDFHYNGFTPDILIEDLEAVGLKVMELRPNSSIECWSYREG